VRTWRVNRTRIQRSSCMRGWNQRKQCDLWLPASQFFLLQPISAVHNVVRESTSHVMSRSMRAYKRRPRLQPVASGHALRMIFLRHLEVEHWFRCSSTKEEGVRGTSSMWSRGGFNRVCSSLCCIERERVALQYLIIAGAIFLVY
jgi:hypothetical protein